MGADSTARCGSAEVAQSIRTRAKHVHSPGCWIGMFEWCIWAKAESVRLHVLVGDNAVDVLQTFAPSVATELPAKARQLHVVAAELTEGLSLVPHGNLPKVNHWLPASVIGDDVKVKAATAVEFSARQRLGCPEDAIVLREYYRPLGFVINSTVRQGDCGPDTALCLLGEDRNMLAWSCWRASLAREMLARADEPVRQAMRVCAKGSCPPTGPSVHSVGSSCGCRLFTVTC